MTTFPDSTPSSRPHRSSRLSILALEAAAFQLWRSPDGEGALERDEEVCECKGLSHPSRPAEVTVCGPTQTCPQGLRGAESGPTHKHFDTPVPEDEPDYRLLLPY